MFKKLVSKIVGDPTKKIINDLQPLVDDSDAFTESARRVWIELADCLLDNRPWQGRNRQGGSRP